MKDTKSKENLKNIDIYPIPTVCVYCGCNVIFTRKYRNGMCYKCCNCNARVGVHNGTHIPLGRLANKELSELRQECHDKFDKCWETKKERNEAYIWLANRLNIPLKNCHFAWFGKQMLIRAMHIIEEKNDFKEVS